MYTLENLYFEHTGICEKIARFGFDYDFKSLNTIYHYTSPEAFINILKDDKTAVLRFTQYDSLNDCNERKEFFEYLAGYCDYQVKTRNFSKEFSERVKSIEGSDYSIVTNFPNDRIDKLMSSTKKCYTYLCCFSKDSNSLAMWNYYTKSQHYEGYCIGFTPDEFRHNTCFGGNYDIVLKEVVYSDSDKNKILDTILLNWANIYDNSNDDKKNAIIEYIDSDLQEFQFIFKNKCFEHEKEVRAILRLPIDFKGNSKISDRKFRTNNGYIIPYVEYNITTNRIYSIIVPPMLKDDIAERNLRNFLDSKGYSSVKIFNSNIPVRF